ncbi:uncharacterized protein LOC108833671 [Raphanus sativus]|uniref:Uncharacterized protein LOC108833671 n=1 Tax=Raphanus sativus TaxID=3726 RepID=A0A6J0LRW3_RAPSA|nr:uncharacterized protein LOC108833671 [Raphanus sativus]
MLASVVRDKLKEEFQLVHSGISTIQESANGFTETILLNINDVFGMPPVPSVETSFRPPTVDAATQTIPDSTTIIGNAINFANKSSIPAADDGDIGLEPNTGVDGVSNDACEEGVGAKQTSSDDDHLQSPQTENVLESPLDPALVFPNPTFSLGLTQEAVVVNTTDATVNQQIDQEVIDEGNLEVTDAEGDGCRKSKRQKVPTKALMGEYECDKGFLNRARKAVADAIYHGGNIDYSAKFAALMEKLKMPFEITTEKGNIWSNELYDVVQRENQVSAKVMDVLMFHTSSLLRSASSANQHASSVFMDTLFVSQFTKMYTKFSKHAKKESYKFSGSVVEMFTKLPGYADVVRIYFPFYLDKKYWVGICVDCGTWSVTVFDCNISQRTEYMMNKEVRPVALMFPYFLKQVGRQVGTRDCKAMAIERPRTIPQQKELNDSAVSSVLFIQAHAMGGIDACKCITPDVIDSHVERLVVTLYEASVGPL